MALGITTLRAGRKHKEYLLQSWHLMCAVNLGPEKWMDICMVQQIGGDEDDSVSSLHSTVFYLIAD